MDKANKLKKPREQRFENRIIVKSSSSSISITVKYHVNQQHYQLTMKSKVKYSTSKIN
jgi:hypothetical protein